MIFGASSGKTNSLPGGSLVKNPPANAGDVVWKVSWRRKWQPIPVFLPGEFPWTEEPGGLQSMGSQRVRHDLVTDMHARTGETWIARGWNYLVASRSYVRALGWGDLKAGLSQPCWVETYCLSICLGHDPILRRVSWWGSFWRENFLRPQDVFSEAACLLRNCLGSHMSVTQPCFLSSSWHSPFRFKAHGSLSEEPNPKSPSHHRTSFNETTLNLPPGICMWKECK